MDNMDKYKTEEGWQAFDQLERNENFLGILFAVTKGTNKGGIMRAFYVCSDGLFPAPDLGKFVLKNGASKSCFLIGHMLSYMMVTIKTRKITIGKQINGTKI